jgi:hypothetical protein
MPSNLALPLTVTIITSAFEFWPAAPPFAFGFHPVRIGFSVLRHKFLLTLRAAQTISELLHARASDAVSCLGANTRLLEALC